jgi:hypothetical protein
MRDILFNQLSEDDCSRSSVHHDGSVARPIQDMGARAIWQCTSSDYLSDEEKAMNRDVEDDDN